MARPSEEFLLAWSSLSGDDPTPGWQAIALPPAGPIELRAGRRSPDGAEAILCAFPSVRLAPAEKLPEGQGFSVERADPEDAGLLRLALTRRAAGSAELFAAMACDVVGALDEAAFAGAAETKLLRVFLGRVGAWQEFIDCFAPDGIYWMPAEPDQTTGDGEPSIFYEDRDLMTVRMKRIHHPRAWSQKTEWGTSHVVSNVIVERHEVATGAIVCRSRFYMMEFRRDAVRHFSGAYTHHLRKTPDGYRIVLQRVDMVNGEAPYEYVLQAWV